MSIKQILEAYEAQPFRPFIMHLADGRSIPVQHREYLASAPSGRIIGVFDANDSHHFIDVFLVTDLETLPVSQSPPGSQKTKNG